MSIGWDVIHLLVRFPLVLFSFTDKHSGQFSGTIENRLSDMRKVVRGCTRLNDFSGGGTVQEQEARVKALFDSFNLSDQQDISGKADVISS